MADLEAKWHGFDSTISTAPDNPDRFRVTIYPKHLAKSLDPVEGPFRVPGQAVVTIVRRGDDLEATEYSPPETPYPGLGQGDYERRGVELVRVQTRQPA